jgi:hypothetical protein
MQDENKPKIILFNSYHCDGIDEYSEFLDKIDVPISVMLLIAAVKKAGDVGIYSKNETDVLSKILKVLMINDENLKE